MEAVKMGSAAVAVRSKEYAVVAALKRAPNDLAGHQKKVFEIDNHMGIAISGLIADARVLAKYMRNECLNHKWAFDSSMQVGRLVAMVSDKAQVYTQKQEKRPYGVGLLVIGYDKTGPHVYETSPSGNYFEYKAQAMGKQSQSARTYLEKHFETFDGAFNTLACVMTGMLCYKAHAFERLDIHVQYVEAYSIHPISVWNMQLDLSKEELINHALVALKGTAPKGLNAKNVSVCSFATHPPALM